MRLSHRSAALSASLVVVSGAAVLLSACGGSGTASAPPADAPPERVVRAYLTAVQDGDTGVAAAVSTPGYAASDPWQHGRDPGLHSATTTSVTTPYATTHDPPPVRRFEQAAYVAVTFTVDDGDRGFASGTPVGWGYVLVRRSAADPWRIAEAGVG